MKRIWISKITYEDMLVYCELRLPEEALGLLAGKTSGDSAFIESFIPIRNAAKNPRSGYTADPAEWTRAWFSCAGSGLAPIGLLHSHPLAPPIPSAVDMATEWRSIPSHWIVSMANRKTPDVEAYRFRTDGSCESIPWSLNFV